MRSALLTTAAALALTLALTAPVPGQVDICSQWGQWGQHSAWAAPVLPDRFGYVSASGGHRSYRHLAGRDGLASRRPRIQRTEVHCGPGGSVSVSEYQYNSFYPAHPWDSAVRGRPFYQSPYLRDPLYTPYCSPQAPPYTSPYLRDNEAYPRWQPTVRIHRSRATSTRWSGTWSSSWGRGHLLAD